MGPTEGTSQSDAFLEQLTQLVLDNLENEQFGVNQLADRMAMSRSQLHRKLKSLKGRSVSQFIREVRLREAMKLLRQDVATSSEIAYRVGFASPSYFSKSFQKYYGFPPGEVKNRASVDGAANLSPDRPRKSQAKSEKNRRSSSILKIGMAVVVILLVALMGYFFLKTNSGSASGEKSIAVLPFNNLSADQENQFFADGIVEDLLNRLSRISEFKVISRTSSDTFRERGANTLPEVARALGVIYIVEGSVQKYGNKARIAVQLIDARNDHHLWSQVYDRDLEDIFKVQSEITKQIAAELDALLTPEQASSVENNRTTSYEAYELFQLGRYHWNKRTGEGYDTSIDYFQQALSYDPQYGLAYAGLADTYNLMALQGYIEVNEGRDKAVSLAFRALELDPTLAEAHNVLASIYTYLDWDWEGAERQYLRAIELSPNYSTVHHYYSEHLSIIGKHEQAREQINQALELDPLSFIIRYVSAKLYFNRGQFKEAHRENQRCLELHKDHPWAVWYDFLINHQLGNQQQALQGFKHFGLISGEYPTSAADSAYLASGLEGLFQLRIASSDSSRIKAEMYGLMGDQGQAMDHLEKSFNSRIMSAEFTFWWAFKDLHTNPRFLELKKRMGLL